MVKNKVIFWRQCIDDVLDGKENVSGIALQMSLWARNFRGQGWEVYCKTGRSESYQKHGMHFHRVNIPSIVPRIHLGILWDAINIFIFLLKIHPKVFIERGPDRGVLSHAVICKILRVKFVFFGASDVNFVPGKDIVNKSERDTRHYRKAIRFIDYFVTQNQYQYDTLFNNYGKRSLIMPNIWLDDVGSDNKKKYDVIWVSNLRPLKRAEWFVEIARSLPYYSFAIIGGALDKEYYNSIKEQAGAIPNLLFMGPRPVSEVNQLIRKSRVLVCTSEYEGFPNTFIQAWAANVPVVSTVDPNNIIEKSNLGFVFDMCDDMKSSIESLLSNSQLMIEKQQCIESYFAKNHNAMISYQKLVEYINI